ncbi:MAG: hypothetical protein ACF8XB_08610 [Planctomycetota bacterium JB042]
MVGRGILAAGLWSATVGFLGGDAGAAPVDGPAAWTVEAVTRSGARYSGVVVRSNQTAGLFDDGVAADLAGWDARRRIELRWFNGLSGSISFKASEFVSLERTGTLTEDELKERERSRTTSSSDKWEKERARLAKVYDERSRRATAAAEAAAEAAEKAARSLDRKLTETQKELLDTYPPEDGWIPAKKTQLYHQTVILDNQPLSDREREWLDRYSEWKPAYDLWLEAEKKRIAAEAAAEQAGKLVAPGERSGPAGTAKSAAAEIDPDRPTEEEASRLPPPLSGEAPEPEKVSETAPKPIPLSGAGG